MRFRIDARLGILHTELVQRETAAEMRVFLEAVQAACVKHGCPKVLMCVRQSRAVFKPEDYGLEAGSGGYAATLATPACQIALVGDTSESNAAHEYIEVVARQQDLNVRAFRSEAAALRWLRGASQAGRRYRFTRLVVLGAPHDAGVYTLWDGEEVIYYGRASGELTLRERLLEHLGGRLHASTSTATHYSWELCADPMARELELLREFEQAFGRLPRCNAG